MAHLAPQWDALVVGAGPAGLSAALTLGRARRRTLVVDAGEPRNAAAWRAHGYFTRDHTPPAELLAQGRAELERYPEVAVVRGRVVHLAQTDAQPTAGFAAELADGERLAARAVFLATGVRDELPRIPGVEHLWGRRVYHCPYCDGWEHRDQPLAVLGNGKYGTAFAAQMLGWSQRVTLCTNGAADLSDTQRAALAHHGIGVAEALIRAMVDREGALAELHLEDGQILRVAALFISPQQRLACLDFADQLNLDRDESGELAVGPYGQTSLARCFVIGDAAQKIQQISYAAAMGNAAAIALNHDLNLADFYAPLRTPQP